MFSCPYLHFPNVTPSPNSLNFLNNSFTAIWFLLFADPFYSSSHLKVTKNKTIYTSGLLMPLPLSARSTSSRRASPQLLPIPWAGNLVCGKDEFNFFHRCSPHTYHSVDQMQAIRENWSNCSGLPALDSGLLSAAVLFLAIRSSQRSRVTNTACRPRPPQVHRLMSGSCDRFRRLSAGRHRLYSINSLTFFGNWVKRLRDRHLRKGEHQEHCRY